MENKKRKLPKSYYLVLKEEERMYSLGFTLNEESSKKIFLEQIDYFTSFFKNKDEMIQYLIDKEIILFHPEECFIIHKHRDEYKKDMLIFNNTLINRLSAEYLKSKKDNIKLDRIPAIDEVNNYIDYLIASCVKNETFLNFLRFYIPDYLYNYLCQYKSSVENIKEELEDYNNIRILKKTIRNSFLNLSYKEFRTIVFEVEYRNNIKKEIKEIKETGTIDSITNERVKVIYETCDGDIDKMVLEYGEEMFESLSKKDQDIIGYTLYKCRLY